MLHTIKTAVIGCGVISDIYFQNLCNFFKITEVVGCSDIIPERAHKAAEKYGIRQMTNEEILSDPEIKIVVNLTYPTAHHEITKAALLAGKHVYSEKMIAVTLEEGQELCALAKKQKLHLVVAPDTFLGGGLQTARWIVDSGMIGTPICVSGICQRSYQLTRPDSEVRMIHLPGGGIPFDMGGYYLHAFINMFGPIKRVSGFAKILNKSRSYLNPQSPLYGEPFTETCINTLAASLEFEQGVLGSLTMTSESSSNELQKILVVGSEGSLCIHDPNDFFGEITVKRPGNDTYLKIPYTHAFAQTNMRGLGVAELGYAIKNNRKPRLDSSLGMHAFEAVHKIWESSKTGHTFELLNKTVRPQAMPVTGLTGQAAESILDT